MQKSRRTNLVYVLFQSDQSFPPLQATFTIRLRATGKPTFSSSSPKPRVNINPETRKPALGLLFRTNSCSNRRLFSLVELTGLFIASQCFISMLAALRGRGHLQHLELNPQLCTLNKPGSAHVGLQGENSPVNKATQAVGGG